MISEMPGPICIRLSGIVGGRWEIVLGQKIQNVDIEILVKKNQIFFSSCDLTLSEL